MPLLRALYINGHIPLNSQAPITIPLQIHREDLTTKIRTILILVVLIIAIGAVVYILTTDRGPARPAMVEVPAAPDTLDICSFNIRFLGMSSIRNNKALAGAVEGYDIVVIQEIIAPPFEGLFPDGSAFRPDPDVADFFAAMANYGFDYMLSEEDTGTNETRQHNNSSSTEWWATFYKAGVVLPAEDLSGGFIAEDRYDHPNFERVPYAFPFRTISGRIDFVLISVHLEPDAGPAHRARRKEELATIATWIDDNDEVEKDFIILGDLNIENKKELAEATPEGFISLNSRAVATNTNVPADKGKPYDHIMFRPTYTGEIDTLYGMKVLNLIDLMRPHWSGPHYPGGDGVTDSTYKHQEFVAYYSDHNPVIFRMISSEPDDDGPGMVRGDTKNRGVDAGFIIEKSDAHGLRYFMQTGATQLTARVNNKRASERTLYPFLLPK